MVDIDQNLNTQNSIFGQAIFSQNVFTNYVFSVNNGIYYSKIFKKSSTEIWHKIDWLDNNTETTKLLQAMKIEVSVRTGNDLPYNYQKSRNYTLDEINLIIQSQNLNVIDSILSRFTLNRSVISSNNSTVLVSEPPNQMLNFGTYLNSTRLQGDLDPFWNYWSFPMLNSPSFIPNNIDNDYLQARIFLQSNDNLNLPEMFRINFSSIQKE